MQSPLFQVDLAFNEGFYFIGQVGIDVDFGHRLDFVYRAGGIFHGEFFVAVWTEERYRVIAASVFHQQGFKEVVGYGKTVGTDIPIGMVGEDGAAYHMNGVVLRGHTTHQVLYLVPHSVVHHIVLRTDVGEVVALFYRLF